MMAQATPSATAPSRIQTLLGGTAFDPAFLAQLKQRSLVHAAGYSDPSLLLPHRFHGAPSAFRPLPVSGKRTAPAAPYVKPSPQQAKHFKPTIHLFNGARVKQAPAPNAPTRVADRRKGSQYMWRGKLCVWIGTNFKCVAHGTLASKCQECHPEKARQQAAKRKKEDEEVVVGDTEDEEDREAEDDVKIVAVHASKALA